MKKTSSACNKNSLTFNSFAMIKFLIEYFLIIFIGILVITQLIIPSITPGVKYWWLFRKKPKPDSPLREHVEKVREELHVVREEVEENLADAQDLKDKITNNQNPENHV